MVADLAEDAAEAAASTPVSSSTRPVEQSGNLATPNQPSQIERRPAAAAKSVAGRLGSPGARAASPKAANAPQSGHRESTARAPRNGRPAAATATPAAKRHAQPKQRPSTSPRFGRVAHQESAPTAGSPPEQRSLGGAASVRRPSRRDETPPPPSSGPPQDICGEVEVSVADMHCPGRIPKENGDPLQWLAPPLDLGEGPAAEWHDTEVDLSEGPVQRSSGESSKDDGQSLRDAVPAAASRLSVESSGRGRGRGGRGRGGRARGGAQHKPSRWH